jgi:hypothetical protein
LFSENEQGSRFFIQREIKILQLAADDLVSREMNANRISALLPKPAEVAMPKDETRHGIVLDEKAQEQPKDKKRAQSPSQTEKKDDELQPLREKSGF